MSRKLWSRARTFRRSRAGTIFARSRFSHGDGTRCRGADRALGDLPVPSGSDRPRQDVVEIVLGDLVVFIGNDVPTARLLEIVLAMRSA